MGKIKVELNSDGIKALLKSKEMESGLQKIASEHSGGWATDTKQMGSRVIASIYSVDWNAVEEELNSHSLVGRLR